MMNNSNKSSRNGDQQQPMFKKTALALALAAALPMGAAYAQDADVPEGMVEEELIVTGTIRDTIRNSIELKREASTIVDAISSSDIGATPDLSVAETLERITGVTADRFKGNASEISIRGLGPFLGASTYNGREVSSGSGNRSVAFSQFPSELVSKAVVYKGQQADIQEGGVAGLIDLGSIRPIDFGKTRFRAEVRGVYNDYANKIEGDNGIGSRVSISYTDVFDTNSGTWGISVGYAGSDTQTPEESYNTSSTYRACNQDFAAGSGGTNCEGPTDSPVTGTDYYYATNQIIYRAMDTEETRDAFMGTVQWQPNDDWDVTLDVQSSNRFYYEDRHDINFEEGRRRISNPVIRESRALASFTGETRIASVPEYRERDEDYIGGGLNVKWNATEALTLDVDLSYSGTERNQFYTQTRLRTGRLWYDWQANVDDWAEVTEVRTALEGGDVVTQEQLNDLSFYSDLGGMRTRFDQFTIEDDITALRIEGEYALDGSFITSVKAGFRLSQHDHNNYAADREDIPVPSSARAAVFEAIVANCGKDFISTGFGEDANFGDSAFDSWASYDVDCASRAMIAGSRPDQTYAEAAGFVDSTIRSGGDVILEEDVEAAFVMASFDTQVGSIPLSGNFGLRVVQNTVTSTGYTSRYEVVESEEVPGEFFAREVARGQVDVEVLENTYTNVLPSANFNFGLTDDVDMRISLYRAVSRPDMWWLGSGRDPLNSTEDDSGDTAATVQDVIDQFGLEGIGNFEAEAVESDNFDISFGWYPNEDTAISLALYHKTFNAGFRQQEGVFDEVIINTPDGGSQTIEREVVGIIELTDEKSDLQGFEITAQHGFTYWPEPFNGLGVSAGYNYADTDFETPEGRNEIVGVTPEVLNDLEPGSLPGFSEESYNSQVYWENYGWSLRLSYKYRSEYLKPFGGTLNQTNRFVRPTDDLSFSVSYDITENLQAKFQVLNIQNSVYVEERVVDQAISRAEYNGTKYFLGLSLKI